MSSPSSLNAIFSIASLTRRSDPKSQLGPVKSGISALSCVASAKPVSGTDAPLGKQFVEHGEDLRRIADAPHGEMRMCRGDLAVGAPQIAVAGQSSQASAHPIADLDIGEILAERQDLAAQERDAAAAVGAVIVAVGGLCAIDVPAVDRITRAGDLQHLFERRRDDRAAGLAAIEERLLVNLLRGAGMADEDDIDVAVTAGQKDMQQHEEPLGEILHGLRHRA